MKKVCVIGYDISISSMFWKQGFQIVNHKNEKPDLIVFRGGTDINPMLYGENPLKNTQSPDVRRDDHEVEMFELFKDTPKVGICRGGQLLNVLSGGSLYQHVDKHQSGQHWIKDATELFSNELLVNSCHHQMMIPGKLGLVLAFANISTQKESEKLREVQEYDPEVIYYEKTKSLCYQPHPEWSIPGHDNHRYFFDLIDYCLFPR